MQRKSRKEGRNINILSPPKLNVRTFLFASEEGKERAGEKRRRGKAKVQEESERMLFFQCCYVRGIFQDILGLV